MPPFDLELTDPAPAAVEAALADAVKTANGKARVGLLKADPADYRRFLADEFRAPEGVMIWLSDQGRVDAYPPTPRGTLLGLVWRTTPLGRTVRVAGRRIEPFQETPTHRFGPPYRPWPVLCHLDPDHVVTRQFTGAEPEVLAMCACGAVGPPDKLAWTPQGMCGPCHDYIVDHGKPLDEGEGPPALRTQGQLRKVRWLPSGKALAAWEWAAVGYRETSRRILVWDRKSGTHRFAGRPSSLETISPTEFETGALLATNNDIVWIPKAGEPATLDTPNYFSDLAFHGSTAAALRYDGEVSRRDLTAETRWEKCWGARRNNDASYHSLAFSPKGDRVALGRREGQVDVLDWPAATGPTLRPDLPAAQAELYRVHALAFSPDGKLIATANGMSGFVEDPSHEWYGWGGSLHLFDVAKGECVAQFPRERDDILCVAFSPDGSLLFTGATDCQIRVVDVATRQEIALLSGHVGCVNDLAFSPDGKLLASAGGDGLVRLWPWRQLLDRPVPAAKKKKGK